MRSEACEDCGKALFGMTLCGGCTGKRMEGHERPPLRDAVTLHPEPFAPDAALWAEVARSARVECYPDEVTGETLYRVAPPTDAARPPRRARIDPDAERAWLYDSVHTLSEHVGESVAALLATAERIEALEAIVRALGASDPTRWMAVTDPNDDRVFCVHCAAQGREFAREPVPHTAGCLWATARALLARLDAAKGGGTR